MSCVKHCDCEAREENSAIKTFEICDCIIAGIRKNTIIMIYVVLLFTKTYG